MQQLLLRILNYDECVRMAAKEAAETEHGIMVEDTAWEGYEEILYMDHAGLRHIST